MIKGGNFMPGASTVADRGLSSLSGPTSHSLHDLPAASHATPKSKVESAPLEKDRTSPPLSRSDQQTRLKLAQDLSRSQKNHGYLAEMCATLPEADAMLRSAEKLLKSSSTYSQKLGVVLKLVHRQSVQSQQRHAVRASAAESLATSRSNVSEARDIATQIHDLQKHVLEHPHKELNPKKLSGLIAHLASSQDKIKSRIGKIDTTTENEILDQQPSWSAAVRSERTEKTPLADAQRRLKNTHDLSSALGNARSKAKLISDGKSGDLASLKVDIDKVKTHIPKEPTVASHKVIDHLDTLFAGAKSALQGHIERDLDTLSSVKHPELPLPKMIRKNAENNIASLAKFDASTAAKLAAKLKPTA